MEMEYFVKPGEDEDGSQDWIDNCIQLVHGSWHLGRSNLTFHEEPKEELAHYAKRTVDIHYRFFPEREEEERQWDELMGIANRTDFDLERIRRTLRTRKVNVLILTQLKTCLTSMRLQSSAFILTLLNQQPA